MKKLDIAEVFQYENNSQILKILYHTIYLPNVNKNGLERECEAVNYPFIPINKYVNTPINK